MLYRYCCPVILNTMTDSEWRQRTEKLLARYDPLKNFELFEELVSEEKPIKSWADFQKWVRRFKDRGTFRGQANAAWPLVTALDRAVFKTFTVNTAHVQSSTTRRVNAAENEKALLLAFQRGAHHHLARTPHHDQAIDWLAMMQHYGTPTRLLDWTRSPYVALYFALHSPTEADAALWSIDLNWFEPRSLKLLRQKDPQWPDGSDFRAQYEYTNRALLKNDNPNVIVSVTTLELNERMVAQQGHFLCSLRLDIHFTSLLLGMLMRPSPVRRQVVSKVVIDKEQRIPFLKELRRMNIHSASLFPGLDGFARSLADTLAIDVADQIEAEKRLNIQMAKKIQQRYRGTPKAGSIR
jgi:FRG domain